MTTSQGSNAFQSFAPQSNNGFGTNAELTAHPLLPIEDPACAAASAAIGGVPDHEASDGVFNKERRLKRKISNRESARRSRARKQRHLDDLRALAARLRHGNRELSARARAARGRVALVRLANAELRAEADALGRRLEAAARQALALGQLYAAAHGHGAFEQTMASLMV
ncbi:bZIP transcription factor 2 [Brachypodium distachyon]|uniref:BZIP domain-containing protein n=1 Tax=Brachypodium distachyon TaxID=15368 RepID=I1GPM5_BRADI|nr:bZIP transcription factor 2 [Brachypodium distachyon]KQK13805.1 hypothetical protein BRADI_1g12620v3 [Brachypodium distachyon]|eukprot:XP_003559588.1 bZIP transcription factor 2 [Brachypodium distachyon]